LFTTSVLEREFVDSIILVDSIIVDSI
jgi:hypothetical protein